jgi:phosphate transport system permease protein
VNQHDLPDAMRPNTMRTPSIPAVRADSEKIKSRLQARRRNINGIALALSLAAMGFGLVWLAWILWTTLSLGVGGLSLSLFTEMTPPPNTPGGGLANAIAGSFMLVGMATLIGTPLGILAGIYLAEYGKTSALASATRFINDILLSAPSIVIGLFVYAVVVARVQHFSGIAGVLALALLQIPIVVRTTENMLNLVPNAMREAAMALGTPKWKMVLSITLKASYAGVITGVLLAVARTRGREDAFWERTVTKGERTPDDFARARELVVGSGAIGATLDLAGDYADQAKAALSVLPASDWRAALEDLADFAVSRAA